MQAVPLATSVLMWFRDDLRLADNPALVAAAGSGHLVVCLYLLDEESPNTRPLGGAARWWLAGSLRALDRSLRNRGTSLILRRGAAAAVVPALATEVRAVKVFFNRRYDSAGIGVDRDVEQRLASAAVAFESFQANLLYEPGKIRGSASPRVFAPFWRAAQKTGEPRAPLPAPRRINGIREPSGDRVADWRLEPQSPDWAKEMHGVWTRGEAGGVARLADLVDASLAGYAARRDRPDLSVTSRLSPHLRFGEVSPFQVWHAARHALEVPRGGEPSGQDVEKFLAELGWREFCWHLLFSQPELATRNVQKRFDRFPWRDDPQGLEAWQRGQTGYPIVDAGMRELWRTGWMHNRVRMIAASFLTKHLLIDWRLGERWFWDTLIDADAANNPANWQWVAGSGADAAPYFRIFNPTLQGEKFDPDGEYVRRYVPELKELPASAIHRPWLTASASHTEAAAAPGDSYPPPVVDHAAARQRALAAFEKLKSAR